MTTGFDIDYRYRYRYAKHKSGRKEVALAKNKGKPFFRSDATPNKGCFCHCQSSPVHNASKQRPTGHALSTRNACHHQQLTLPKQEGNSTHRQNRECNCQCERECDVNANANANANAMPMPMRMPMRMRMRMRMRMPLPVPVPMPNANCDACQCGHRFISSCWMGGWVVSLAGRGHHFGSGCCAFAFPEFQNFGKKHTGVVRLTVCSQLKFHIQRFIYFLFFIFFIIFPGNRQ